jgi:hypothetical protein
MVDLNIFDLKLNTRSRDRFTKKFYRKTLPYLRIQRKIFYKKLGYNYLNLNFLPENYYAYKYLHKPYSNAIKDFFM